MTKEQFYDALKVTKEIGFLWGLHGTGECIRAQLYGMKFKEDDCLIEYFTPLTAVYLMLTGNAYHPANDKIAAKELNLSQAVTADVIHGSDFSLPTFNSLDRQHLLDALEV